MKILLFLFFTVLTGCASETLHPQAVFEFNSSKENLIKARHLLHDFSITNNLRFIDYSHKYPSGKLIVGADAERIDGLQIMLLGASDERTIAIAIHCHKKCSEWKEIYNNVKSEFAKHWELSKPNT